MQASTQEHLRRLVEQLERLELEKAGISDDIRAKFLEAKSNGFDVKAIRTILNLRKKPQADRDEEEAVLDTYKSALGMLGQLSDTPLGQSYLERNYSEATV